MAKFNIGDRVEIIYHLSLKEVEPGKVIYVGGDLKSSTQPAEEKYGSMNKEIRYVVELDDGVIFNDLREEQLRKIE